MAFTRRGRWNMGGCIWQVGRCKGTHPGGPCSSSRNAAISSLGAAAAGAEIGGKFSISCGTLSCRNPHKRVAELALSHLGRASRLLPAPYGRRSTRSRRAPPHLAAEGAVAVCAKGGRVDEAGAPPFAFRDHAAGMSRRLTAAPGCTLWLQVGRSLRGVLQAPPPRTS